MLAKPMTKKSPMATIGLVVRPTATIAAPRAMKPAMVIGPLGALAANQPMATPPTTLPKPSDAISQP
jgi:hypothetical protein